VFLVDTNVWLETLLEQERAPEAKRENGKMGTGKGENGKMGTTTIFSLDY
jgi:hypothetical protein